MENIFGWKKKSPQTNSPEDIDLFEGVKAWLFNTNITAALSEAAIVLWVFSRAWMCVGTCETAGEGVVTSQQRHMFVSVRALKTPTLTDTQKQTYSCRSRAHGVAPRLSAATETHTQGKGQREGVM